MDIELLGQSFRISTDEDNQYISQLVEHYQKLVHTVKHTTNTLNTNIVAILAGILAVDEYFKSMRAVNNRPAQSTADNRGVVPDAAGVAVPSGGDDRGVVPGAGDRGVVPGADDSGAIPGAGDRGAASGGDNSGVASGGAGVAVPSGANDIAVQSTTHIESVERNSFSAVEDTTPYVAEMPHHGGEPSHITAEEALVEDEATQITNEILDKIGKIFK